MHIGKRLFPYPVLNNNKLYSQFKEGTFTLTYSEYVTDEKFVLDFLKEKHILFTHGGGFHWDQPDHFRVVFLPEVSVLSTAADRLNDFLSTYHQN